MGQFHSALWEAIKYLFPNDPEAAITPEGAMVVTWRLAQSHNLSHPVSIEFAPAVLQQAGALAGAQFDQAIDAVRQAIDSRMRDYLHHVDTHERHQAFVIPVTRL